MEVSVPLSKDTIKRYRTIGHNLKPVVMIAENGLSEGVVLELERAFQDHELIKVKVAIADRDARKAILSELCTTCKAEKVQEIGKVALLFKVSTKKDIKTSNVR